MIVLIHPCRERVEPPRAFVAGLGGSISAIAPLLWQVIAGTVAALNQANRRPASSMMGATIGTPHQSEVVQR